VSEPHHDPAVGDPGDRSLLLGLYGLHRGGSAEPATLARRARAAEQAGIESLWVGDHIVVPVAAGEAVPTQPRLEAVVAIAHLAALTSRVRLAFGVLVLPQRQPVLLAKQLSSIDYLSQGRLIVGIGVGYVEPELRALGASLDDRGARTEEYLAAMRMLWAAPVPTFEGNSVSFSDVVERPLPVQQPHPPIVIGAQSPRALSRVVRMANGWYGWDLTLEDTADAMAALRDTARRYQRPAELGPLEITVTPHGIVDADTARRYADLGVDRLVLQPPTLDGSAMDDLIAFIGDALVGQI
jgi:probable F420-dependent oxidoreductase